MELWEYNIYVKSLEDRQKGDVANALLTGYYAAYYTNGGKKSRPPSELIKQIFAKKQSFDEGRRDIERLKKLEKER